MTLLTKNFTLVEFACPCGACPGVPDKLAPIVEVLAQNLQRGLRDALDVPITIMSGVRCKVHNETVGGGLNSYHLKGNAADIKINAEHDTATIYDASFLAGYIEAQICNGSLPQGGLGTYANYARAIHYDTRDYKARWHHWK